MEKQETVVMQPEEMLMKLGSLELVLNAFVNYVANIERDRGDCLAPNEWAVSGAFQNIAEISTSIKKTFKIE